jgi:hypothetical protein
MSWAARQNDLSDHSARKERRRGDVGVDREHAAYETSSAALISHLGQGWHHARARAARSAPTARSWLTEHDLALFIDPATATDDPHRPGRQPPAIKTARLAG